MDMHETAALAIYSLQGATVNGRVIKVIISLVVFVIAVLVSDYSDES